MPKVDNYLQDTYKILRDVLGVKLGLLGQYEYLVKGKPLNPPITNYAISILQVIPDLKAEYRLIAKSGLEAILEGESCLKIDLLHHSNFIARENYKLTILQHADGDYEALDQAVKALFRIPSIRPLKTPIYRPRLPIDAGLKGKDNSYSPATLVMELKRNH